jgi:hypothetical protein
MREFGGVGVLPLLRGEESTFGICSSPLCSDRGGDPR